MKLKLRYRQNNFIHRLVAVGLLAVTIPAVADHGQFGSSPNLIGRAAIKSGGPPKDGIPALTNPKLTSPRDASYLKPDDLVIGLAINGEAALSFVAGV
jgi:hypothetical protein